MLERLKSWLYSRYCPTPATDIEQKAVVVYAEAEFDSGEWVVKESGYIQPTGIEFERTYTFPSADEAKGSLSENTLQMIGQKLDQKRLGEYE